MRVAPAAIGLVLGHLLAPAPALSQSFPVAALDADDFEIIAEQTVEGVGAAQGIFPQDGFVYIFGDSETGVIRQYTVDVSQAALKYTGVEIRLTVDGEDVAPHPTGLTSHPEFGTFLGNTVGGKGRILHIDWDLALAAGTLDDCVLNVATDDHAVNGCRPEYAVYGGGTVIATSDYGGEGNRLRLYDPIALAGAARTSEEGVLLGSWACGPFVQSLRWLDELEQIVLVQNQTAGLGYRFTFSAVGPEVSQAPAIDLSEPTDELEGFAVVHWEEEYAIGIVVSAMRERNVRFIRVDLADKIRCEARTEFSRPFGLRCRAIASSYKAWSD